MTLHLSKRTIFVLIIATVLFIGASYLSAWTAPVGTPPNNNVAAPINTSSAYQYKQGDLGALRMRAGRYCDANGNNCWDPAAGVPGGGSTITVGGVCFEPAWAVTCNWNWSGSGNDNSTYIVPGYLNPTTQACSKYGRTYAYHSMLLAQCFGAGQRTYAWTTTAWGSCIAPYQCASAGTQSRTVTCVDSNGFTASDSSCSGPKPSASQSCRPRQGKNC